MVNEKNILIFGELDGNNLSAMTIQLMRIGKQLSEELKVTLNVLFLGDELKDAGQAYCHGADNVYIGVDPLLKQYVTDSYLQAMEKAVAKLNPAVILFGQNDIGMDLAPRLAFRLNVGVTLDCVDLKIDKEKRTLESVKPVFGGKAHGHFISMKDGPQIASIRDGAFDPAPFDETKRREVIEFPLSIDPARIRTRFVKKERDESIDLALKLSAANTVVCGGRGLKDTDGMNIIQETAELIGGAIAGSRPAVDYGLMPHSLQIGLTGKKVSPKLYFAVGVSGALQHMVGCIRSKTIIAINTDKSAPIFRFSHFGVIGDFKEVLKGFNDEMKTLNK